MRNKSQTFRKPPVWPHTGGARTAKGSLTSEISQAKRSQSNVNDSYGMAAVRHPYVPYLQKADSKSLVA